MSIKGMGTEFDRLFDSVFRTEKAEMYGDFIVRRNSAESFEAIHKDDLAQARIQKTGSGKDKDSAIRTAERLRNHLQEPAV